jgi:hypothetical protein
MMILSTALDGGQGMSRADDAGADDGEIETLSHGLRPGTSKPAWQAARGRFIKPLSTAATTAGRRQGMERCA